jgi:hypothetical protein
MATITASANRPRQPWPAELGQWPKVQTIAQALLDAYLEGAERSDDPACIELLQMLAERAVVSGLERDDTGNNHRVCFTQVVPFRQTTKSR